MKTIHLNLASRPYRDYRAVYTVAALLGVATAILLVYNLQTAYRYFVNTRETRAEINATTMEVQQERRLAQTLEGSLRSVNLRALNAEARYINAQIEERAFSWSRLLDQLERVFPRDVRLISLNPSVDKDSRIHLEILCAAKTSDGMVRLINRMIADPHFVRPFPRTQMEDAGTHSFALGVEYHPDAPGVVVR